MADNPPRTCTIHINAVDKAALAEHTGFTELNRALGYLATWNLTHKHVEIMNVSRPNGVPELSAVYYTEAGGMATFEIHALWQEDPDDITGGRFAFHT